MSKMNKKHDQWLVPDFSPNPSKTLLFCFPFAGGGVQFYAKWQEYLDSSIQVCPVFLPGRERRIRDLLIDDMSVLIEKLVTVIGPFTHHRYAIFGHSMGALIGHLLSCALIKRGMQAPTHLFVSGRGYIHPREMRERVESAGFEAYLDSILSLSTMTDSVLKNKELRSIFLPIFRADVKLCANWELEPIDKLPVPITAIYGDCDDSVSPASVKKWGTKTSLAFHASVVRGEHLFVLDEGKQLCDIVNANLSQRSQNYLCA
ncbi:thioesterase II family protein [Ningiella sp. W23]|uniref:thioesterase II family protein n=1 Tax=Ningiella sp. W23 TaxID=3023715 RepID=UPI00375753F4